MYKLNHDAIIKKKKIIFNIFCYKSILYGNNKRNLNFQNVLMFEDSLKILLISM